MAFLRVEKQDAPKAVPVFSLEEGEIFKCDEGLFLVVETDEPRKLFANLDGSGYLDFHEKSMVFVVEELTIKYTLKR